MDVLIAGRGPARWWRRSQHRDACRDADAEAGRRSSGPQRTLGRRGWRRWQHRSALRREGNYHNLRNDRKGSPVNQERDSGLSQRFIENLPQYKPEYWDKVDYLDVNGNAEDTNFRCFPAGVPRMGPPTKIMATATEVVFLYNQKNTWRLIPLNRPHDPINSRDQSYMGDSVGKWEGDTLVVDVTGFNDETWLEWPGYFHTNKMHVIERLRREGNVLHYQVTVEDPDVLMQPWVMDEEVLRLNTAPMVQVEDPPCVETDGQNMYRKNADNDRESKLQIPTSNSQA
jgi:hypothetical protein